MGCSPLPATAAGPRTANKARNATIFVPVTPSPGFPSSFPELTRPSTVRATKISAEKGDPHSRDLPLQERTRREVSGHELQCNPFRDFAERRFLREKLSLWDCRATSTVLSLSALIIPAAVIVFAKRGSLVSRARESTEKWGDRSGLVIRDFGKRNSFDEWFLSFLARSVFVEHLWDTLYITIKATKVNVEWGWKLQVQYFETYRRAIASAN